MNALIVGQPNLAWKPRERRRFEAMRRRCLHPDERVRCTNAFTPDCGKVVRCGDGPHDELGPLCPRCGSTEMEVVE